MASLQPFLLKLNILSTLAKSQHTQSLLHHHRTTTPSSSRRSFLLHTLLLSSIPQPLILPKPVFAFELRLTEPDQTLEEAQSGILSHARSLLRVKDLLEKESWKEAQKSLRKSSSLLKQDIYTIILAKPPDERSRLRKLYSNLFNAVTRLDYAARDEDSTRVWESYDVIVLSLDNILSRV